MMGGQACVCYGAAEFSRDLDLVLLAEPENLRRLMDLLTELNAECVAVPPFELSYLARGHAVHFRCRHTEAMGLRIDLMSKLRGMDEFPALWLRRTSLQTTDGVEFHLLSLPDLVKAKKTQRDKDWPMIRRLLEANYFENRKVPRPELIDFWLLEMRTLELLIEITERYVHEARKRMNLRPLLRHALAGDAAALRTALIEEETQEQEKDRRYWEPLKRELAEFRRARRRPQ
jgi:hypothetical protein